MSIFLHFSSVEYLEKNPNPGNSVLRLSIEPNDREWRKKSSKLSFRIEMNSNASTGGTSTGTVETGWMSIAYGVFWRLFCDINRFHYPLEIIGFYLVRLGVLNVCTGIFPVRTGKNEQSIIMRHNYLHNEQGKLITITVKSARTSSSSWSDFSASAGMNIFFSHI